MDQVTRLVFMALLVGSLALGVGVACVQGEPWVAIPLHFAALLLMIPFTSHWLQLQEFVEKRQRDNVKGRIAQVDDELTKTRSMPHQSDETTLADE